MKKLTYLFMPLFLLLGLNARAVEPTMANVAYGTHPKQVLDFYKADTVQPASVMFFIHGGSWLSGDKKKSIPNLEQCLNAGISVVSIEYRFIPEATADGLVPPVKGPLLDAARALQFVRSKASEWNACSRIPGRRRRSIKTAPCI